MTEPKENPLALKSSNSVRPVPQKDVEQFKEYVEEHPILLKPTDVLDLRSSHQKQLFHGYFRSRWGFMNEFNQMYNEGLALFSSEGITITLKYMEKFLSIMRDTYYPGKEPNENAVLPRTYDVTCRGNGQHDVQIIMTHGQVCKNWPEISTLISCTRFVAVKFELIDSRVEIEKLPETVIETLQ